jgi:glycosyltransferase involved in cell wall biosynthesis
MSAATLGLRIPIVWHVHDLLLHHPLSTCIRTAVLLHPPTRIVVVANAAAERFKGKLLRPFPRRVRIDVVYNAVAAAELSGNTSSIRKELRLRGNDRLIGLVGNLSPVKGQLELLRAFAKVRQQVPGAALLIVGSTLFNRDDGYQQQLHAEVRSLGLEPHVRFLGQRDDVPAIMSELDLLVLNSRSEAFPLVALEGMTAGVPVLATAVGGLPELIMPAENGLLIPFGDEAKLIEAIQLLLKRPGFSGDLARRAREHVTQNYSVSKFVSSFEAIYTAVVQKPLPAGNERLALSSSTTLTNV